MPTLNDVKSAFYDAQRNAANAFEVIYADLKNIHDQYEAKAKAEAAQKPESESEIKPKVEVKTKSK